MATVNPIESGSLVGAQADLDATTLTDVFTQGRGGAVKLNSIVICNRGAATTFRLSIAYGGAADDVSQYLYYDAPIDDNETIPIEWVKGKTLVWGDVIRAYAGTTDVTVQIECEAGQGGSSPAGATPPTAV